MRNTCIAALAVLLAACGGKEIPFDTQVVKYDTNKIAKTYTFGEERALTTDEGAQWKISKTKSSVKGENAKDYDLTFTLQKGTMEDAGVAVEFTFDDWEADSNYLFAPAAIYNGNRFHIHPVWYPPFIYDPEKRKADMPITTTNIPHLNEDMSDGRIEILTNNCATPLVGFYNPSKQRGFFLLTRQDTILGNSSFIINEHPAERKLSILMGAPGVREHRYSMCNSEGSSNDRGIHASEGQEISMAFRVYDFEAKDLMAYFDKFMSIRKALSGQNEYRLLEPFSSVCDTIMHHHFRDKWYEDEKFGYYCNAPWEDNRFNHLQLGWGGSVPAETYMLLAHPESHETENLERMARTFESIQYMQGASGLFYGIMRRGELLGDNFAECEKERDVSMIRRTIITIYWGLQCFDLLKKDGHADLIRPEWEEMIRKACDALVTLWNRYGEFGQFIKAETGEMYVPNSTQGALGMGALAYASNYFGEPRYMEMAEEAGRYYYKNHLAKGYTGGGPCEILQTPDSESAAELTESYIVMYEMTREEEWLQYARDAAALFSSWVISYDYTFPENADMRRSGVKTTGATWASVQNEHGAPGIYVMSGDFLLKLYRATGDKRYLELEKDITHNVLQYVNMPGNHFCGAGWGCVTERVNISDWESKEYIGYQGYGDSYMSWELVSTFSMTETPGIYVSTDTGELTVFDHVEAEVTEKDAEGVTLKITNPTTQDAKVSVMAESKQTAKSTSMGWHAFRDWQKVEVHAGEIVTVKVKGN